MRCETIRELLPLHVEGDLSAGEAGEVRLHLAGCPGCRAEEAALLASQAFWKEAPAPSFDEAFHAAVRRGVQRRLTPDSRARESRWRPFPFWLAVTAGSAAAAALGLAFLLRAPVPAPAAARPAARPAVPAPPPPPVIAAQAPPRPAPLPVHRRSTPRGPEPAGLAPASSRVTRIEMGTSDPNVRIIWLARASDPDPI